jgi:hypothetical protein
MCSCDNENNCIKDILCVILVLQQNACGDSCLDSCDRPMLGGGPNCLICNTRPVMLYTCCGNGVAWSMPVTKDDTGACTDTTCSNVFKVEKVEGNCATFRVLQANPDTTSTYPYVGTNSIFTMNLGCICSIRCLSDTYIDCCL